MITFEDYSRQFRIRFLPNDSSIYTERLDNGVWVGEVFPCTPLNIVDGIQDGEIEHALTSVIYQLNKKYGEGILDIKTKTYFSDTLNSFSEQFDIDAAKKEIEDYSVIRNSERNSIMEQ